MGLLLVVHTPIVLDDDPSFGEQKENFWRKTLISKTAMNAFDEAILPQACRLNIGTSDQVLFLRVPTFCLF